ncbi:MAG: hypothetical protein PWQ50_2403 [Methanolobus sp.]|nr:hypothetical protein [Methanolobus sp.]
MKVSIIGGATGSGKTTLILKLAKYLNLKGEKIGVIVQETGEVDYDEKTLTELGIKTREVNSVCIPCSADLERMELVDVQLLPSVVLVDSPEFETADDQLTEYVRKQTAGAEIVCMGKVWLDTDEHSDAVWNLIRNLNPDAKVLTYPENDDENFLAQLLG